MEITKKPEGTRLTIAVTGSIDTNTAPKLQSEIDASLEGVTDLSFDFSGVEYVSSAGLRVLLIANKRMVAAGGTLQICGIVPAVREVFDMTGFSDIFTIV